MNKQLETITKQPNEMALLVEKLTHRILVGLEQVWMNSLRKNGFC